ncbi:MAG: sulfotransferase domain-containing protein, partial [Ekhidna sp.]|nr:sulfotransferase domain-containing protein [Ekhidna sp.]
MQLRKIIPKKNAKKIAIFSVPRSGSTWLSEVIAAMSSTIKVDEPLFRGEIELNGSLPRGKGKLRVLDDLGFFYYQPIPIDAEYKEASGFFSRLFKPDFASPYLYEETNIYKIPIAEKVLFKFCYGNMLLPWLMKQYKLKAIILMRNPYAVIASQLSHYSFETLKNQETF